MRTTIAAAIVSSASACSSAEGERAREPSTVIIDDMEGAGGRIAWKPADASPDAEPGRWVSYADTQCADLEPIPEFAPDLGGMWSFAELSEPHETLPGVTSRRAARLRTKAPLVNTWGAGMGFEFSELPPGSGSTLLTRPCTLGATRDLDYPAEPVDLRRYSKLSFFGRASQSAGSATVLVQVQDGNTDPRGGRCDPVPGSANECYNGFGVVLALGPEFERYEVDFAELAQNPNWGYRPQPSVVDLEHVYGLAFQVDTPGGACPPPSVCLGGPPELTFDIWIDDLWFVER